MSENEIGYIIRGACFNVYNSLGPGLLESAYEKALIVELQEKGLSVRNQVPVEMCYKGQSLGKVYRMDILVAEKVIVEVKSIEKLENVHFKQLLTYLRITGLRLGYMVNFNTNDLKKDIIRYANQL